MYVDIRLGVPVKVPADGAPGKGFLRQPLEGPQRKVLSETARAPSDEKAPQEEIYILCRDCLHPVTRPADRISVQGRHRHTFANPPVPAVAEAVESERYHNLDAVRGFALLLGVVFHAGESFGRNNHYWAIVDSSPSDFLEWFRFACHSFRMELFFLIAGFFARLLIGRRGISGFIRNRLQRILVPLVVGWCVLYPLLVLLWL